MSEICPICGEPFENRMKLGSHMWSKHKVKLKEYEAQHQAEQVNESAAQKPAEALFKPSVVKESKEFVNEKPAMVVDKDIVSEGVKKDTDFVQSVRNPYRDLYPSDGFVINERLG